MLNVGLIGCGHISETYFRSRDYFNNINITTCADLNIEAANKCSSEYNIVSQKVEDLLDDKDVDTIKPIIKQLKKRGFQKARILGQNERGLTRVAVASFYTQEEADKELIDIRLKLSSAWVLANE